jgi:predicted nucleotidyltransferase
MIDLVQAAHRVQGFLIKKHWRFCFIGGIAVQQWGEPRLTRDVDLTILTGFGGEEAFIDDLLREFVPRVKNAKAFALKNRVLLLKATEEIGMDVSLGGIPFEEKIVSRSADIEILKGISLRLCSAEDLIVLKAFAAREIDWHDVRGIVTRQGSKTLDWTYILGEITPLTELKGDPEILPKLAAIRAGS